MTHVSTFRRTLLLGCALGASLGWVEAAGAQAVNATPDTVAGVVQYSRFTSPTPGSETVTVFSDSAIINWTPPPQPPGPYVFLPAGNLLRFENGPQNFDFVVLNRILTTNPSRFDGIVISRLQADSINPERPGGTVLFSSPGGIIVGSTALFDVGNLVLTTLNVVTDANNSFITPAGGFQFNGGDAFPNAAVLTEPGARFVATAANSYIAMVAPRVIHGGDLRVNGSAAYIGAEAVEISVNQGLFDIVFTTGSDNPNPVVHTGSSGGPASTAGSGDNHAIHFAAVPKNQAITMLLQGNVGFDPATVAGVENGVIVLSAGYNVDDGQSASVGPGGFPAGIAIADGAFASDTNGRATGDIAAAATAADPLTFAGDLRLDAAGRIDFVAGAGAGVQIGEDLDLTAAAIDLASATAAGDITLDAAGPIIVGFAQAGDDFRATAGTTFAGTTVVATGLAPDSESDGPGTGDGGNIVVDADGDLRLDNGTAPDTIRLASAAGSILSDGTLRSTRLIALTPLNLDLNDVFVIEDLDLATAGGFIDGNSFNSDGDIILDASGNVSLAAAKAGDDFTANAGGTFTAGAVTVGTGADDDSGALAGGNIVVDANGNLRLDNGTAPDTIRLASAAGSILSDGTLRSTRLIALTPLNLDLNDVFVIEDLDLATAGGFIDGNSFNSDGDIALDASGNVSLAAAKAGDDFTANAGGTFTAGAVTVGTGADDDAGALAGGNIVVDANGDLRLDNGTAPDRIDLGSSAGSILSNGTLRADRLDAVAALDLALNDVVVVQDLVLAATNGSITGNSFDSDGDIDLDAAGAITLASADSGGSIDLSAVGDVRLDSGRAAGALALTSTGGSVNAGNGLPGGGGSDGLPVGGGLLSAGSDLIAIAAVDVTLGDAEAGDNIFIDAGRDVGVRNLSAAQSVGIDALRNAAFAGAVLSPTITVTSADIDIAATGALGGANTQLVTLNVRPSGTQTVLGGGAEGPGYTLTDAEAGRIRAARLIVQAPATGTAPGRAPDLLIRELSLSASRTGQVDIVTPGIAEVQGDLTLANAGAASALGLRADQRLQIVTPLGGVRVRDAAGLAAGTLVLASSNIWSASRTLLDRLIADPNFAGRDAALTLNDGPVNPRGSIEAADVTLLVRDSLFVQNSGTLAAFAGITVRENTLTIAPTGQQPLAVFAFGARVNPDGSFVTNNAFFREVAFQRDGAGFTDQAQFNLCFINSGICRLPDPDDPVPGGRDTTEEPVGDRFPPGPGARDDLVDTSFSSDRLIEEPVTSGSDPVLWDCDRDDDGDCDEDDRDE